VVVPKKTSPGNPWSRQGCYWDHEPQTEVGQITIIIRESNVPAGSLDHMRVADLIIGKTK